MKNTISILFTLSLLVLMGMIIVSQIRLNKLKKDLQEVNNAILELPITPKGNEE